MKKLALALAATAAFAGQAIAADMPARMPMKAAPVAVAAVNWTGCYIGGGGGYGMYYQQNTGYDDGAPFGAFANRTQLTDTYSTGGKGWFGTVQGGCDYQFNTGSWAVVVGAFGDYDFSDIKGRRADVLGSPVNQGIAGVGNETLTDSWAVGGRIGLLVTPQLLTYFSGGYTEARFGGTNYTTIFPPFNVLTGNATQGSTFKGWFLGAGDEYALSFLPGLFWKTEARASHFDRQTQYNYIVNTNIRAGSSYDAEKWVYSVRSELVWRFNWGGGAVVAKY